jgi:hypothetical protein
MLRELNAEEEVRYLRELHGPDGTERILAVVVDQYNTLHNRSQTLLGLVTICLTISGFSGPSVAASGPAARWCISIGLALVLASAVMTLAGPLQLRWATQWRGTTDDDSLVSLIRNRNSRTRRYNLAFVTLVLGLSGYVGSLVSYLLSR